MLGNRRNLVFRVSIVINIAVLLYAALHLSGNSSNGIDWVPVNIDAPEPGRSTEVRHAYEWRDGARNDTEARTDPLAKAYDESTSQKTPSTVATTNKTASSTASVVVPSESELTNDGLDIVDENALSDATLQRLRSLLACNEKDFLPVTYQRGEFWVLKNYVRADHGIVLCHESVTYTTHAGFEFLDNVLPLVERGILVDIILSTKITQGNVQDIASNKITWVISEDIFVQYDHQRVIRWMAPVSLAIHAPGADLAPTVNSIRYLRDCTGNDLIRSFVSFHVFFSHKHIPSKIPDPESFLNTPYNCTGSPPYVVNASSTYMKLKSLLYPVNVARNVARDSALTHFILPSDIELYPSPNLVPRFLNMIARNGKPLNTSTRPRVFPISIFEVDAKVKVPSTKTELQAMLKKKTAIPFHKFVCPTCHNIPQAQQWMSANETTQMDVFHVGKRKGKFVIWEPIFIGTHNDPYYDERLSWEGKKDKMTQGYILCVKDYDFMILNNAFLTHKPGIKHYTKNAKRDAIVIRQNHFVRTVITPELKKLFGTKDGCAM